MLLNVNCLYISKLSDGAANGLAIKGVCNFYFGSILITTLPVGCPCFK